MVVGEVEQIVGSDRGAVRIFETDILSPGPEEFSVAVEDDHGMGTAGEDVDIVPAVHADRRRIAVGDARRQFPPAFEHPIPVPASSQDDGLSRARSAGRQQNGAGSQCARARSDGACGKVAQESPAAHRTQRTHEKVLPGESRNSGPILVERSARVGFGAENERAPYELRRARASTRPERFPVDLPLFHTTAPLTIVVRIPLAG